jgi:type II secretory pathway component GspD/PulD (secretin)
MKTIFKTVLLLLMALCFSVQAEKVKKLRLNQDDAQSFLVSKTYELKHTRACDIAPFVEGAVKRYNVDSNVQRLDFKAGGKEILVVSTGVDMMPYIDDMIAKVDIPGVKDVSGSVVEGTGISRFAYYPKNRATKDMLKVLRNNVLPGNSAVFLDESVSMLYWKCSKSDGDMVMRWINELDRPVPQVQVKMRVYEVRDSDLTDIGINYIAWKNGPGMDLFGAGLEAISLSGWDEVVKAAAFQGANVMSQASWAWGGFFCAPQFDFSFVRMLAQDGKARIADSGSLTVVNDFDNSYSIKFTPDFQNIIKTPDTDQMSVEPSSPSIFEMTINQPVICFKGAGNTVTESADDRRYDEEKASTTEGTIMFNYFVSKADPVERNNFGQELYQTMNASSNLTLAVGNERLLATWKKEYDTEQTIGMPFLSDIPILKYLFGTTTKIKSTNYYFVTVKAEWVMPDAELAGWAGKLLSQEMLIKKPADKTATVAAAPVAPVAAPAPAAPSAPVVPPATPAVPATPAAPVAVAPAAAAK